MRLSDKCQRVKTGPIANEFGRNFPAAVVDNNDFETRPVQLLHKGSQTLIKWPPVVINT